MNLTNTSHFVVFFTVLCGLSSLQSNKVSKIARLLFKYTVINDISFLSNIIFIVVLMQIA